MASIAPTVSSGQVSSGGTVTSLLFIASGGSVVSATIADGGELTVESGGSASGTVVNLGAFDEVGGVESGAIVHGYAGAFVQAGAAGAVLALSDGSQVTFTGASVASIQQAVKLV